MTSPIATVGELIAALEDFDDQAPVRLAFQPGWPFEHSCGQVAADDGAPCGSLKASRSAPCPAPARHALGW